MTPEKQNPAADHAEVSPGREPVKIIPFPIGRRPKLIKRIALAMKRKPSNAAANDYLAGQMTIRSRGTFSRRRLLEPVGLLPGRVER